MQQRCIVQQTNGNVHVYDELSTTCLRWYVIDIERPSTLRKLRSRPSTAGSVVFSACKLVENVSGCVGRCAIGCVVPRSVQLAFSDCLF